MKIGESFPIAITIESELALSITANDCLIVVANNYKKLHTFKTDSGDGAVSIDVDDDNNPIVLAHITRAQSLLFKTGRIQIELLIKTDDPAYPDGFFSIAQFEEPVERSITISDTL
jgi:hypothetical protein